MAVVGFNFNKISVERRKGPRAAKVSVNNNVEITDVSLTDLSLGRAKQQGINLAFEFTAKYEPPIGHIAMAGEVLCMLGEDAKPEDVIKQWKKSKQLPAQLSNEAITTVLMRCNVEALLITRDVNIPPPMPIVLPTMPANAAASKK